LCSGNVVYENKEFKMKVLPGVGFGAASGGLGGVVASRNRSGQYLRGKAIPVNPNTVFQQSIKAGLSSLVEVWRTDLTVPQREAWTAYANTCPRTNSLGLQYYLTGLQMFIACNQLRLQAGLAVVSDGPTAPGAVGLDNTIKVVADATDGDFDVSYANTEAWANEVGGHLLVFVSQAQSAAVNFFKGPYRYAGKVSGGAVRPTSPFVGSLPIPCEAGQKIFVQTRIVRADGRISPPFRCGCVVEE
jgi:hypothetical protein